MKIVTRNILFQSLLVLTWCMSIGVATVMMLRGQYYVLTFFKIPVYILDGALLTIVVIKLVNIYKRNY